MNNKLLQYVLHTDEFVRMFCSTLIMSEDLCFVPKKRFKRNKTHRIALFVPLNRFIRNKIFYTAKELNGHETKIPEITIKTHPVSPSEIITSSQS